MNNHWEGIQKCEKKEKALKEPADPGAAKATLFGKKKVRGKPKVVSSKSLPTLGGNNLYQQFTVCLTHP